MAKPKFKVRPYRSPKDHVIGRQRFLENVDYRVEVIDKIASVAGVPASVRFGGERKHWANIVLGVEKNNKKSIAEYTRLRNKSSANRASTPTVKQLQEITGQLKRYQKETEVLELQAAHAGTYVDIEMKHVRRARRARGMSEAISDNGVAALRSMAPKSLGSIN